MPKSVFDAFIQLLKQLEPKGTELIAQKSHKRTIEQALSGEFQRFNSVQVIGSHTRSTAIHVLSDVDYFAMLGAPDVTWANSRMRSTTILERVKRALQSRFPQTGVWIDGPAVVVGFGQGNGAVDVVPGVWTGTVGNPVWDEKGGYPRYDIPDGDGWWLATSPQRHGKYLRDEDTRCKMRLSETVKLLKCWKYSREPRVPILAFHLELLLASEGACPSSKAYQNCLLDAFRLLRDRAGRALNDPLGISSRIPAVRTDSQAITLAQHADYAVDHATRAICAEINGDIYEAFRQWDIVFNGQFPSPR